MSLVSSILALAQAIAQDFKGLLPKIQPPVALTESRTMTAADSGTHFFYNGLSAITLTFPAELPLGFKCRVSMASNGQVLFDKGGRLSYGNASRDALTFQWDVVEIFLTTDNGAPVFLQTYNLGLPVSYAENNAALTRSTTALSAVPGLSLQMDANSSYDVDVVVPFTSSVTTESLKIGATMPAGAVPSLEVTIFNTNASGTTRTGHFWPTAALAASGTSGASSVVGQTLMAHISGKVRVGATAGPLAITAGARDTSGTISVAANAAAMSLTKLYDQDRT